MTNNTEIDILEKGVDHWNSWRNENPELKPSLKKVNRADKILKNINFNETDLKSSNLSNCDLSHSNLSNAHLNEANLKGAKLIGANLSATYFLESNLDDAKMNSAKSGDSGCQGCVVF